MTKKRSSNYTLGATWAKLKLAELKEMGVRIERKSRFDYSVPENVMSVCSRLKIAEYIGNLVGFDRVILEPSTNGGDADIKFYDDDTYYLQIKSPQIYVSPIWRRINTLTKQFYSYLNKWKSEFAIGYANRRGIVAFNKVEIPKGGRRVSFGILAFDASIVPDCYFVWKFLKYLTEAQAQLIRINDPGRKMAIVDIFNWSTRGNYSIYYAAKKLFHDKYIGFRGLDGFCLFSVDFTDTKNHGGKETMLPVYLKNDIQTPVFRRSVTLYRGTMIELPTLMHVKKGWNDFIYVDKEGFLSIDGVIYGHFWNAIKLLTRTCQLF